jgi:hypothetical protein
MTSLRVDDEMTPRRPVMPRSGVIDAQRSHSVIPP